MSKQAQREKQRARRVRREHGLREAAVVASRPQRRRARVAVGLLATLAILFLGVLGSVVTNEAAQEQPGPTTSVSAAPATGSRSTEPPPCPAPDGSSGRRTVFDRAPEMCIDVGKSYQARFVTTAGTFVATLDPQRSPLAVNNFVFLARYHFYDGLPFHRVVPGFYAQSGAPDGAAVGPGYSYADDPLPERGEYQVGSLVMAHERADDNGSQFVIWLGPEAAELDPVFPLFGQVVEGLDVLQEIGDDGGTAADPSPATRHVIERVEIIE
ncbi:MAG: peptidylprolyl isomerase [Actinomycetota bacterium]|nr:peptidylprolyl isomerase [Actinomycetota bacterium]